jgi:hypothetical protein
MEDDTSEAEWDLMTFSEADDPCFDCDEDCAKCPGAEERDL